MRIFESGATRDDDTNKIDYEGFLSPLVLERYGKYMNSHRIQADGKLRDSDNWQKGISLTVYIKSMWRHFLDLWKIHRGCNCPIYDNKDGHLVMADEALCAIIFNASGYLHELLKQTIRPYECNKKQKCSDTCEKINQCSQSDPLISIR